MLTKNIQIDGKVDNEDAGKGEPVEESVRKERERERKSKRKRERERERERERRKEAHFLLLLFELLHFKKSISFLIGIVNQLGDVDIVLLVSIDLFQ